MTSASSVNESLKATGLEGQEPPLHVTYGSGFYPPQKKGFVDDCGCCVSQKTHSPYDFSGRI